MCHWLKSSHLWHPLCQRLRNLRRSGIPPLLGILEAETDNETNSDCNQNIYPNSRLSVIIKPILPSRWNCKFSGDKEGMSLSAFLEKKFHHRMNLLHYSEKNIRLRIIINNYLKRYVDDPTVQMKIDLPH